MKPALISILLFISSLSYSQHFFDSVQTSVGFNLSFGMMRAPADDFTSIMQSYNPTYAFKFKKTELGLGIDYSRYSSRYPAEYGVDDIWSFSAYLRRYFFRKEYLFGEIYMNTGYWDSRGELALEGGNRFVSALGLGAGVIIPPFGKMKDHKYLRNLNGIILYRESFINRDIFMIKREINVGVIYRF